MYLRRFSLRLIFRIILILINTTGLGFVVPNIFKGQLVFTFLVLLIFLILQIILLIHFLKRSNRLLTTFLLAISNEEYSLKFSDELSDSPYKDLNKVFNKVLSSYKLISKEKEGQNQLIHKLMSNIGIGIIVLEDTGDIKYMNDESMNLLRIERVSTWDSVKSLNSDFASKVDDIKPPEQFMYEPSFSQGNQKLSIGVNQFHLFESELKLIVIKDVRREVEAGELDAMQKLVRILTHEIMNSVTPINSLSETIEMLMGDKDGNPKLLKDYTEKNVSDIRESVLAIKDRIEGLDHFVSNYRKLTKLPETIKKEIVLVDVLCKNVLKILNIELAKANIEVDLQLKCKECELQVDIPLIEQVLINLLSNSIAALEGVSQPKLKIKVFKEPNQICIQIIDNGIGIEKDKLSNIFIPFYTTKEKGSGIGLSFARQIMRLHKGTINAQSEEGKVTVFSLSFPVE